MATGDHLYVRRRGGYTHHGIDAGDGRVIHYSGEPGSKVGASIRYTSFAEFALGGDVRTKDYGKRNSPELTLAKAEELLGTSDYNLFGSNCEHFASWCVTDKHRSAQVNGALAAGSVGSAAAAAAAGGVGLVSAAGAAAGLSGAGVMSGLATAGGVVGGGAVAGLAVLGAAPGIASAAIMQVALADDECLSDAERGSRAAGRKASVAGAAVGTAAGVGAVSATGVVAGLSGAGITSGLAAVGATFGGGMVAGSAAVIAAPAVAAAALGYGTYRVARFARRRTSATEPPAAGQATPDAPQP